MDLFDFSGFSDAKAISKESDLNEITPRSFKMQSKISFDNKLKRENVEKILTRDDLPKHGESLHIVSNGSFDYFTLIPRIIVLAGKCTDFYFSTWTMSHNNVSQILDMFDNGDFTNINALTGEYFRSRESAVYSILELGIKERKQRLVANKNHSKVTLLMIGENYFIIEGSANFTANPRIEQFTITNHKDLYHFHKEWMLEILIKNEIR